MAATDYDFNRLLDATLHEPWKVPEIIASNPSVVAATNSSGETAIHWLIVENQLAAVELLFKHGARIESYALTEACGLGHLDMVYLLLGYGVEPNLESCARELRALDRNTRQKLERAFVRYGYRLRDV